MASIKSLLIVEDEPLIAMLLEDFARSLGFDVVGGAESVDGALECVAAGGFDGAILDVNLRGGRESWPVADALAERAIPFVLATGGHIAPPPARHANAPTLMKPYTMDGVRNALETLSGASE